MPETALPSTNACPYANCGGRNWPTARFCARCGRPLTPSVLAAVEAASDTNRAADESGGWARFVGLITIGVMLFWMFGFFGLAIWCAIGLGTMRGAGRCGGEGVCW